MLNFQHPEYLWIVIAAALLGLVAAVIQYLRKKRIYRELGFIFQDFQEILARIPGKTREITLIVLVPAIIMTAGLTAMQPFKQTAYDQPELKGSDIYILMDITYSMQAPVSARSETSRMEQMRKLVVDALSGLETRNIDHRFHLIAFSHFAWSLTKYPTNDYSYLYRQLHNYLNIYRSWSQGRNGSNIGSALIEAADKILRDTSERKKIVILMSDGEPQGDIDGIQNHISDAVGRFSKKRDISFIIVGLGDPESELKIPKYDAYGKALGGYKNENGSPAVSRSDFNFLQKLARDTNGAFIAAGDSGRELLDAVGSEISTASRTGKIVAKNENKPLDHYFSFALILLLIIYVVLLI